MTLSLPKTQKYTFSCRRPDRRHNEKDTLQITLELPSAAQIEGLGIKGSEITQARVLAVRKFLKGTTEFPSHTTEYAGVDQFSPSKIIKSGDKFYAIPYNALFEQVKAPRSDSVVSKRNQTPNQTSMKTGMLTTIGWNHVGKKKVCTEFVVPFANIQYIQESKDATTLLALYEIGDKTLLNCLWVDVPIRKMRAIWKMHLQNPNQDFHTHDL